MCNPLTVSCNNETNGHASRGHEMTFDNLIIPCKTPGTEACKAGMAELVDFQNAPTTCAGKQHFLAYSSEECIEACQANLKEYGPAIFKGQIDTRRRCDLQ